jgi:DNA-binding MarR family transcriptional regulator
LFTVEGQLRSIVSDSEERGLMTRAQNPTDARAWQLDLPPKSEAHAKKALAAQKDLMSAMCDGVTVRDIG